MTIALQAFSLVAKADPVQGRFHTTLEGTNGVSDCKMDVNIYMDSYIASNGSCFMVTWTLFKNHLLEVGLTPNGDIIALSYFKIIALY